MALGVACAESGGRFAPGQAGRGAGRGGSDDRIRAEASVIWRPVRPVPHEHGGQQRPPFGLGGPLMAPRMDPAVAAKGAWRAPLTYGLASQHILALVARKIS